MASPRGRKHYKKPGQEGLFRRGVVFSGQRHADHKDKNDHRVEMTLLARITQRIRELIGG